MNGYKKIPLKFSHKRAGYELRHVEALKARESSRFKRLSMIRSMDDCDLLNEDSMESPALPLKTHNGPVEVSKDVAKASNDISSPDVDLSCKIEKNSKPSAANEGKATFRKEMLFKWQHEKILKKELESKIKKKPFYVGVCQPLTRTENNIKPLQNLKSFISQPTKSFNASKIAKSRIVTPSTSVQPPQSRIPYNFKAASTVAKAANAMIKKNPPTIKKPYATARQNTVSEHKPSGVPSKVNIMAPVKKTLAFGIKPKNDNCQKKISTQTGMVSRNASSLKNPAPMKKNENFSIRPPSQIPSVPKSGLRIPKKVVKLPQKVAPSIPKPASNIRTIHKTTAITSKLKKPDKSQCQNPPKNPSSLKAPNKAVVENSVKSEDIVNVRQDAVSTSRKKANLSDEKFKKPEGNICSTKELLSEQSHGNATDAIFHCDVSVITPISKSFAPEDFKFQPPIFHNFFEDDLCEAFEQAKQKYSRTSTPSKCESGRTSRVSSKRLNDSLKKENSMENTEPESISDELCQLSVNIPTPHTDLSNDDCGNDPSNAKYNKEISHKFVEKENIKHVLVNISNGKNVSEESLKNDDVKLTIIKEVVDDDNEKAKKKDILEENISKDYGLLPKPCIKETSDKITEIESTKINIKIDAKHISKNEVAVEDLNAELVKNNSEEVSKLITEKVQDMYSVVQPVLSETNFKIVSKEIFNAEYVPCELPKNTSGIENISNESLLFSVSPPEMPDFNEIKKIIENQMQNIEEERKEQDADIVSKEHEILNNKSAGVIPKRVSMFKRVSVLNSITETDDTINESATEMLQNDQTSVATPRRSVRLSRFVNESNTKSSLKKATLLWNCTTDSKTAQRTPKKSLNSALTPRHSLRQSHSSSEHAIHKNSPKEGNNFLINVPMIPRRSMRLQKADHDISESHIVDIFSPFGNANCRTPRRSMRLINLNHEIPKNGTCVESAAKTNLTSDFQRLKINSEENMDPNNLLIDLENSPEPLVSKKVSLLYSPQRKRSMRRSIKGDLMFFSPSGN